MGQANKVISAFLLLAVAIFVLWLMLTKTQSMRNFFTGKTPLTQMFSKDKPKDSQVQPTAAQKQESQSDFVSHAQETFSLAEQKQGEPKGGVSVQTTTTPTTSKQPGVKNYPKTGAESIIIPISILSFVLGKRVLKLTETK